MNKIVFFGNEKLSTGIPSPRPLIREAVMSAGFEIEQVVTGKLSDLQPHESQLAVLAAYGRIIPQKILDEFPLGIINVHPSLLPKYRGPTPIEQAILDGEEKTGVSIMRLTKEMDEGPIYKQKSIYLQGNESKEELTYKLQSLGADLIREVLPLIATGELTPRQQPHPSRATYCTKITKDQGEIDWKKQAITLEREIRAYGGWPKSHCRLGSIDVIITKAHARESNEQSIPGKIIADKSSLSIGTVDGLIEITSVQPMGKKEMPISAFLSGYRNRLGLV